MRYMCVSLCAAGIMKTMCYTDTDDAVDIEMQCDMLIILSLLCDGDMHRKVRIQLAACPHRKHPSLKDSPTSPQCNPDIASVLSSER